jgi:DNA-binding response OmpR family regulator
MVEEPAISAGTQVLVVSDDPQVRAEARFTFPSDVQVLLAMDAREAWQIMQAMTPAVALLDIRTGSAGGFGLARDMSMNDRLRDVPVFMLLERIEDGWLARQAGAATFRTKPIDAADLVAEVLTLLPARAP